MTDNVIQLQQPSGGAIAALANITVAEKAFARLRDRGAHEPGLGVMHGPSGWGKSVAASWLMGRHAGQCYYVQADDFWTKKTMLVAICRAIGIAWQNPARKSGTPSPKSIYDMAEAIKLQLESSRRILIIDEFDYVVDKNLVESIRSLYEGSKAGILVIGEQMLPAKLRDWERFDGRILDWFPAEAISVDGAHELARLRCPGITVEADLLAHLVGLANGSVRRVSNNLSMIRDKALSNGWDRFGLAHLGDLKLQVHTQLKGGK
ncbi:MAG: ATP-binding protein [Rhodocyclaceae bacterium]|nr:ATP-binding protein [Rhodocyclaceae bacterium]